MHSWNVGVWSSDGSKQLNSVSPQAYGSTQRTPVPSGCTVENDDLLGDGSCDEGNNNTEACGWDLGDCCLETCGQGGWYQPYECGISELE